MSEAKTRQTPCSILYESGIDCQRSQQAKSQVELLEFADKEASSWANPPLNYLENRFKRGYEIARWKEGYILYSNRFELNVLYDLVNDDHQ